MKSGAKIAKRALIGSSLCAFFLVVAVFSVSATGLGWTKYGPYHRPSFIYRFEETDVISDPKSMEKICVCSGRAWRLSKGRAEEDKRFPAIRKITIDEGTMYGLAEQQVTAIGQDGTTKIFNVRAEFVLGNYLYSVIDKNNKI